MSLKEISNDELIERTNIAVKLERASTADVARHFQEISRRKLFLDRGFPNLYEMATKHFGYCAGSAMRRINSMRLMTDIPDVESKLESGELSLTVAADVQSFFYAEAKLSRPYSMNAKIELIETCLNKSKLEVERELCRRNPEREKRESIRLTSDDRLRVSFSISQELHEKLQSLRDLLSHSDPNISMELLIDRLAELGLNKHDPSRRAKAVAARKAAQERTMNPAGAADAPKAKVEKSRVGDSKSPPQAEVAQGGSLDSILIHSKKGRFVMADDRHQMSIDDDGQGCVFVDSVTGHRCGSKRFLEKDHITPHSYGGSNKAENLQYTCSAHNKFRWQNRAS